MINATHHQEALLDRFGLKVAARLNEQPLPHDISERLRVARQSAMAMYKKQTVLQTASSVSHSGGAAVLGGDGLTWWNRIASALPLLALAAGLIVVNVMTSDNRARELAEVDVQLLTDELPPSAHADAGFAQYLKFGPPGQ
ncbi:MAG: DUF3619 family protein [Burkholderiaceae bacterium]